MWSMVSCVGISFVVEIQPHIGDTITSAPVSSIYPIIASHWRHYYKCPSIEYVPHYNLTLETILQVPHYILAI